MLAFSSETEGGEVSGGVSVCHCAVRTDCRAEKLDPVGSERGVRAGEASYASGLGRSRGSGGVVTCKDSLLGCRLGFGLNFSSLVLSKKKYFRKQKLNKKYRLSNWADFAHITRPQGQGPRRVSLAPCVASASVRTCS